MLIIGMAHYFKDDYPKILKMSEDPEKMEDTWEDWLKKKEELAEKLSQEGFIVQNVLVIPHELEEYCWVNGFKINGDARAKYAQYLTQKQESSN